MCSSHPILQHAAQSRQSEPFGVARAACVELSASVYADNGAVLTDCNNKLKTSSTTGEIYRLRQLRRTRYGELNPKGALLAVSRCCFRGLPAEKQLMRLLAKTRLRGINFTSIVMFLTTA